MITSQIVNRCRIDIILLDMSLFSPRKTNQRETHHLFPSGEWEGGYSTDDLSCHMIKFYATHSVLYDGNVDENGIWGTWTISPLTKPSMVDETV